jgi:hypothetical protein
MIFNNIRTDYTTYRRTVIINLTNSILSGICIVWFYSFHKKQNKRYKSNYDENNFHYN